MKLEGCGALVTGGGTGLGREVSLELARRGANVGIVYSKSRDEAAETVRNLREMGVQSEAFQADVADSAAVRRVVSEALERFGRLDVLVNNSGMTKFVAFPDLEGMGDEDWDRIQEVNVKGAWMMSKATAPELKRRRGAIINIASVAGIRPGGSSIAYCVSKAALIHLTKCLAVAFAPDVRVNCVAPGLFLSRGGAGFPEERIKGMIEATPLKRPAEMADLARAAVELAANDSITGEVQVVDAGISLG